MCKPSQGRTSAAALDKAVNTDAADLAIVPMDGLIDAGKTLGDKDPRRLARAKRPISCASPTSRSS